MKTVLFGTNDTEDTPQVFTPWSIIHLISGAAAKQTKIFNPVTWFLAHGAYELKDQIVRSESEETPRNNSMINSVGDQALAILGYHFTNNNPKMPYVYLWVVSFLVGHLLKIEGGM